MDDHNTFERRVAGQIHRFVGPPRPVNDAAIFNAITTAQSANGRIQSMFSATKIAFAGALVALLGGFLLASYTTTGQRETSLPGAEAPFDRAPASVTGSYGAPEEVERGVISVEGDVRMRRDETQSGIVVDASDPRFSGEMVMVFSDAWHGAGTGTFWGTQEIRNDDGSWTGRVVGAGNPLENRARAMGRYDGDGAYEGLAAVIFYDTAARTFEGVIYPGELPPIE